MRLDRLYFKIYNTKRIAERLLKYLESPQHQDANEWVFSFDEIKSKVCNRYIRDMIDELEECIEKDD